MAIQRHKRIPWGRIITAILSILLLSADAFPWILNRLKSLIPRQQPTQRKQGHTMLVALAAVFASQPFIIAWVLSSS